MLKQGMNQQIKRSYSDHYLVEGTVPNLAAVVAKLEVPEAWVDHHDLFDASDSSVDVASDAVVDPGDPFGLEKHHLAGQVGPWGRDNYHLVGLVGPLGLENGHEVDRVALAGQGSNHPADQIVP